MKTSFNFRYSDKEPLVYFTVDTRELFNLDLDDANLYSTLIKAYEASKEYCPYKTGLMRKSYTIKRLNAHAVMCFFDPTKILGAKRLGQTVTAYYPAYLTEYPKTHNFLDKMMKEFYAVLKNNIKLYNDKPNRRSLVPTNIFYKFLSLFNKKYKMKLEETIKMKKGK